MYIIKLFIYFIIYFVLLCGKNKIGNLFFNDVGVFKMVFVFYKVFFLILKKYYELCVYIWELFFYDKNGIKVMYLI